MILPDKDAPDDKWFDRLLRYFAVVLEIAIFIAFIELHSRAGIFLCLLYVWFSATWDMLRDDLDSLFKEKK